MCGIAAEVQEGNVRNFDYLESKPPCRGKICARGHYLKEIYAHPKRLLAAGVRADEGFQHVTWDEALKVAKTKLSRVMKARDGVSIGIILSGNSSSEESYLASVLAREIIQTNYIASSASIEDLSLLEGLYNSDLALASAKLNSLKKCDHFLIVGDVFHRHPPLARFIQQCKFANRRNVKVVVVDSRKSATSWFADTHLQPVPGTDTALFLQLAFALHDRQGKEKAPKQVLQVFKYLKKAGLPDLEKITGVNQSAIATAAQALCSGSHGAVLVTGGFGALAGGTVAVNALNLAAHLGGVERKILPLFTYGNSSGVFAVGQSIRNETKSGKDTYVPLAGIVKAVMNHELHGLLVFGEDLLALLPTAGLKEALHDLDFILCSASFPNELTQLADVVLPRAEWFERSGSVVDGEGKFDVLEAICTPPGDARSDEEVLKRLIKKLKGRKNTEIPDNLLDVVKKIIASPGKSERATKKRVEELAGVLKQRVITLSGDKNDNDPPFLLVPRMGAVHFADGSLSRRFSWPKNIAAAPDLFMNADDARAHDLRSGDKVKVKSTFGSGEFTLKLTETLLAGTVVSSGHFPEIRTLFAGRLKQHEAGVAGIVPEKVTVTKAG